MAVYCAKGQRALDLTSSVIYHTDNCGGGAFIQVVARYAKDLLEKQTYPEVRRSPRAPAQAPDDVSAWSLGMQFGVKPESAKTPLATFPMDKVAATPRYILPATSAGGAWRFPYNGALSAMVVNRLLKGGAKVSLTRPEAGARG